MDVQEERTFDFIGERLSLDFANTAGGLKSDVLREHLKSYGDLVAWGKQAGVLQPEEAGKLLHEALLKPLEAEAARQEAIKLRGTLRSIFVPIAEDKPVPVEALAEFNRALSEAMCHSQMQMDEYGHFEWGWENLESSFGSVLWPVLRSAADVLVSGEIAHVHQCAGDTCGWLFLDTTRNHSRQWCDMRDCGNRAKAKRHYQRRKGNAE